MFSSSFKRHVAQFAISAVLAAVTPAAAAGLVEGVRVAATAVDQAGNLPPSVSDDSLATAPQPPAIQIATREPAPLTRPAQPGATPATARPRHAARAQKPAQQALP
jgi:hypothetical protein